MPDESNTNDQPQEEPQSAAPTPPEDPIPEEPVSEKQAPLDAADVEQSLDETAELLKAAESAVAGEPETVSSGGESAGSISNDEIQAAMAEAEAQIAAEQSKAPPAEQIAAEEPMESPPAPDSLSTSISEDEIEAAIREARMEKAAPAPADAPPPTSEPAANVESGSLTISADEIEAAMQQMLGQTSQSAGRKAASELAGATAEVGAANDVEAAMLAMLNEAEQEPPPKPASPPKKSNAQQPPPRAKEPPPDTQDYSFEEFAATDNEDGAEIELLDDVELEVKIELGRTEMYIEDVLGLGPGSVVELDRAAGDPVDIFVNERLVARGEVLVLNDNFCVRINDILSPIPELELEQ